MRTYGHSQERAEEQAAPLRWLRPALRWALLLAFVVLATLVLIFPAGAQDLVPCTSKVSLDGRLEMQQWAIGGDCTKPARTRVTDRFLGFTCVEQQARAAICRSYAASPGSRAFDTSRSFRCVDIGVADSDYGIVVRRMREWAAPQKECDWNPYLDLLAMEVDFENGQVCVAALCMRVDRLTAVGRLRLRLLIEKAFRELDLGARAVAIRPALVGR